MGIIYWLARFPFAWFWMLLALAIAVLPVVGISFIVIPVAILALLSGNPTAAILGMIHGPVKIILLLTAIDIYTRYCANNDGYSEEESAEETITDISVVV